MGVMKWRVDVSTSDRAELEAWLRSQTMPHGLAVRARIVLGSGQGESIRALAARLDVSQPTVCRWRDRYRKLGIAGLKTRGQRILPQGHARSGYL